LNVVQTAFVSPPRCVGSTHFVFTLTRVALLFASATPIAPLPLVSLAISEGTYEKCDKIAKPATSGAEGVEPQAQRPTRRDTPSGVANGAAGAMSKRRDTPSGVANGAAGAMSKRRETTSGVVNGATGAMSKRRETTSGVVNGAAGAMSKRRETR
jgi:hypothetical protein